MLLAGALPVVLTTPPVAEVAEQRFADVLLRYEAMTAFPFLTLEGNLNCTPEKRARFVQYAGHATLRRRLVPVQRATGLPPPEAAEKFDDRQKRRVALPL